MPAPDDAADRPLLQEQIRYYRAAAAEYEDHALPLPGMSELARAVDDFAPAGRVLELACGPGTWTPRLLAHAEAVTAVDASPEMLARAERRTGTRRVRYVRADVFTWRPDSRYDVVFFGFWLSHVPPERLAGFWSLVGDCLAPGGRVLFVDDFYRTPDEVGHGEESAAIRRRLSDGSTHRIVKVPWRPAELQRRIARLGWDVAVHPAAGPFVWGSGRRAAGPG